WWSAGRSSRWRSVRRRRGRRAAAAETVPWSRRSGTFRRGRTTRCGVASLVWRSDMNSKVTVAGVMTTDVVTVPPTAPFKEVARVLVSRGISAVPVVDEESRLLGVVSEADLLVKESGSTGWKRPAMIAGAKRWRKWAKARATTAAEAMTPAVKSIEPTASLSEAARRLTEE